MLYEKDTGYPVDKSYYECDLPPFLQESLRAVIKSWEEIDSGQEDSSLGDNFCWLYSDINNAEVNGYISSQQAWYLRDKYLRLNRE